MKFSIIVSTLILSTSCLGWADFLEAEKAFEDHRYTEAIKGFEQEIKKNNDYRANYYLGKIYLDGLGVSPDPKKALDYLNESIKQDYDAAQALMGYLYEEGRFVSQDKRKAISLYKQAAEHNNSSAKLNLALAYYKGESVPKDTRQAIILLKEIDINEIPKVGRYLGEIYLSEANPIEATESYKASAQQGDVESFYALGDIYIQGENIPKAIEYYTYAASMGNIPAQYILGTLYLNGTITERNVLLGHAWLKMAADQGYMPALTIKNQVDADLSRSETEAARQEFLRLQNQVMGRLESPFIEEQRQADQALAEQLAAQEEKGRTRRRRR